VLENFAYLNAGAVGPVSAHSDEAMAAAAQDAVANGRASHHAFVARMEMRDVVRDRVASLIGVAPDNVALTTSTTQGCEIVVGGFGLHPGDEVVTTDAEHPGLEGTLAASPATIRVAPVLGKSDADVVEAILAEVTERTRLIALSHVLWLNGQVLPITEIRRRSGLPLLVDGAQSVGAIDVTASDADFYTVSGQKWLCGPELTGALYVARPETLQRRRILPPGPWYVEPTRAASLELLLHPATLLAGFLAALEDRPADATARGAAISDYCVEALAGAGVEVVTQPGWSRLVGFTVPGAAEEVVDACQAAGVVIRSLPNGWLRASCGWWNSPADVDRLVAALPR
jgi:L-cysteine/cystine lyase